MPIPWLPPGEPFHFPEPEQALDEPNGLLAAGGDLNPNRLLWAYRNGIFPWYSPGEPILWWSPAPRMVLYPADIKISRSLRKTIRNRGFRVSHDQAFEAVIGHCTQVPRADQDGTWISDEMRQAYALLHALGHAHSVEVWLDDRLVGGLYGIEMGRVFFGESMFSLERDASKVALAELCYQTLQAKYELIDCQVYTSHLASLGAAEIPRPQFTRTVRKASVERPALDIWGADWGASIGEVPQETVNESPAMNVTKAE
ncbi:MAG: leucyl/phenylalanyl-tRNA--protein transferase [Gammaproteobacteria bacterium]